LSEAVHFAGDNGKCFGNRPVPKPLVRQIVRIFFTRLWRRTKAHPMGGRPPRTTTRNCEK
jgi:hypothetical protein